MPLTPVRDYLPLQQNLLIRTTDRKEALGFVAQYFPGIQADFKKPDGIFEFQMNSGQLASTHLTAHDQYIAGGARFMVDSVADRLTIEIPVIGSVRVSVGARTVDAVSDRTLIVTSPGQNSVWDDDGLRYRCLILHFDMELVKRRFAALTGSGKPGPTEFDLSVDITKPTGKQFLQAALLPFMPYGPGPGVMELPASAALYEDFLINAVLTCLRHDRSDDLSAPALGASPKIVQKCEDYLHAHADGEVTISEISESLGVSVRSLQRTYQKARGTTPMRRLKQIRLERARSRLLSADGSVTKIALSSGFSHLGAFSADYKKEFGETPSETLQRSERN